LIDKNDYGKFIELSDLFLGGQLICQGKGLEDEGKMIESWLKELQVGQKVRVEDTQKIYINGIYKITNIGKEWEEEVFKFKVEFKRV